MLFQTFHLRSDPPAPLFWVKYLCPISDPDNSALCQVANKIVVAVHKKHTYPIVISKGLYIPPELETLVDPLAEHTISQFAARLSSSNSTPGGGAVAALTLAVAASMVQMVANISIQTASQNERELYSAIIKNASDAQSKSMDLADEDCIAYESLLAAFKLPKLDANDKRIRKNAIQTAAKEAACVPVTVARLAKDIIQLCDDLKPISNTNLNSDRIGAVSLACSVIYICIMNVRANIPFISDQIMRERLTSTVDVFIAYLAVHQPSVSSLKLDR